MHKPRTAWTLALALIAMLALANTACTQRDFLTRHSAADIISNSDSFRAQQEFWLRTGIISNKDYLSPEYLVLQHRGWITGVNVPCSPDVAPPPCWDVALTPLGVGAFRDLVPNAATVSRYFSVPTSRRELVSVTGISKEGNFADVDFLWKWVPLNEVGEALAGGGVHYRSSVTFKHYDDGWRVVESVPARTVRSMDDALKTAEAVP